MIETANELRNRVGTGHGRVAGKEPVVTATDAGLIASAGLILAAWLLRHERGNLSEAGPDESLVRKKTSAIFRLPECCSAPKLTPQDHAKSIS